MNMVSSSAGVIPNTAKLELLNKDDDYHKL